ncbi:MAG TPA: ABC transporter ATP-binding protein [Devosiaceae bacterium]|jgi:ABC-type Fe3+/spermidine/putrescine transport system ATPase subunit
MDATPHQTQPPASPPQAAGTSQSVHLEHVLKRFGAYVAISDLSLDVAAGEFVTLLGPSGCGKTTTLRMIAGLMPQDGGEIRFGARRVDLLPANKRNVGLVFQNYALFPHMTVAENVGFGLRMRGWSKARQRAVVEEFIALVRLEGLGERKPGQLSGGQQQRVAVARALAFNPDLVLLDEPLSNLDAKLREQVRLDLRAIQRRAGQTTIFVTHDQVEALVMSDRVVLMNQGAIEQIGPPQALYMSPETEFAARFIGANNLIPGTTLADGAARADGIDLTVTNATRAPGISGPNQKVWICIRPEQLAVSGPGDDQGRAVITAHLRDVIFQGTSVLLDAEAPGIGPLRAECPPAAVAHLNPGDEVALSFAGSHLVPRESPK